jgi:hypothetical protein
MNKTQFDRAVTFNSGQLGSNALTSMCGPLTRASIEAATAD